MVSRDTAAVSRIGQPWAVAAVTLGTRLAKPVRVLNFFMAGPEMVRCELTAEQDRGCRLTIHHAHVTIVEHCRAVAAARLRQQQLEDLLLTARGGQ